MADNDIVIRIKADGEQAKQVGQDLSGVYQQMAERLQSTSVAAQNTDLALRAMLEHVRDMSGGMQTMVGHLGALPQQLQDVEAGIKGAFGREIKGQTDALVDALGKAKSSVGGFGVSLGNLRGIASQLGVALGAGGLIGALVGLGVKTVETASQFEQFHARLEALSHSVYLANEQMVEAKRIASTEPFDIGDVTAAIV
ncbi:MAG: hypothetical protein ACYCW6_21380, partial [Candidatus Xenobia bacterium]